MRMEPVSSKMRERQRSTIEKRLGKEMIRHKLVLKDWVSLSQWPRIPVAFLVDLLNHPHQLRRRHKN